MFNELPDSFLQLTYKFKSLVLKAVREAGIDIVPMEIKSLHLINRTAGCTAAHMAATMERDKGQIARLIREMIAKGLIAKSPNPKDTRSQLIELTDHGQSVLARMLEMEAVVIQKMLNNVSPSQVTDFNAVASLMLGNLKE